MIRVNNNVGAKTPERKIMRKSILCVTFAALLFAGACGNTASESTTAASTTTTAATTATTEAASETTGAEDGDTKASDGSEEEGENDMTIEPWLMGDSEWTVNDDETVGKLPDKAQEVLDKALADYTEMTFTPVAFLGVQVVAGTNYMYLCRTAEAEPVLKVVIVYNDLSDNASVSLVSDFDLDELYDMALATDEDEYELMGGWTVSAEYSVANLPAEVEEVMADALADETEKTYESLALLGQKAVSGTEYAVLTYTTKGDETAIEVSFFCASEDGANVLVDSIPLDLASYNQ